MKTKLSLILLGSCLSLSSFAQQVVWDCKFLSHPSKIGGVQGVMILKVGPNFKMVLYPNGPQYRVQSWDVKEERTAAGQFIGAYVQYDRSGMDWNKLVLAKDSRVPTGIMGIKRLYQGSRDGRYEILEYEHTVCRKF